MDKKEANKRRAEMLELAMMPLGKLMELAKNIDALTPFHAMWVQVLLRATKGDVRAASFMQEHIMGKPVQRIKSEHVTYKYQDLLTRIKFNEHKYQIAIKKVWGEEAGLSKYKEP